MTGKFDDILRLALGVTPEQFYITNASITTECGSLPRLSIDGFIRDAQCVIRKWGEPIKKLDYKKVIFNNPATVVLWKDGTKTVVKCDSKDVYSPITGLALCFMKKALGNSSRRLNDVLHEFGM